MGQRRLVRYDNGFVSGHREKNDLFRLINEETAGVHNKGVYTSPMPEADVDDLNADYGFSVDGRVSEAQEPIPYFVGSREEAELYADTDAYNSVIVSLIERGVNPRTHHGRLVFLDHLPNADQVLYGHGRDDPFAQSAINGEDALNSFSPPYIPELIQSEKELGWR